VTGPATGGRVLPGGAELPGARGRLAQAGDAIRRPSHVGEVPRGPVRTCVGCRVRADRSVLLRVVASENDGVWFVVPDPRRRLKGRGAWLHPDPACLDLAERRRVFARALRLSGAPALTLLREYLAAGSTAPTRTVHAGSGSQADEPPMSTQR